MKKLYFCCLAYDLSSKNFLPYPYAALHTYCDTVPRLVDGYQWQRPLYRLNRPPEEIAEEIVDPDVLAISCYMWNIRKQLWVAELVKKKYPDCLIVAGGPEIPNDSASFLKAYPFVDLAVHGEGEIALSKILLARLAGASFENIKGVSFSKGGRFIHTGPGERLGNLQDLPSPYLLGYLDDMVRELQGEGRRIAALWETNRGCPYSCSFCDWGSSMTGTRIRSFSEERIYQELEWFSDKKIDFIYGCDANFGILSRDEKIVQRIIELNEKNGFPDIFHTSYAKMTTERIFRMGEQLAKRRLTDGVMLAVQSMDQKVLESVDRKNIKLSKQKELIDRFRKASVPINTDLIIGLPEETKESYAAGIHELMRAGFHECIRFNPLAVLVNAPMNKKEYLEKYKIKSISRPYLESFPYEIGDKADTIDLVCETSTMTTDDWVWMRTYSSFIQTVHLGAWTRFISIYLSRRNAIDFAAFYGSLFEYFKNRPETVLGSALKDSNEAYQDVLVDPERHYLGWMNFTVTYKDNSSTLAGFPFLRAWMSISTQAEKFYEELNDWLEGIVNTKATEFQQALRFQREIMLTPDYSPQKGKTCYYDYNFHEFFFQQEHLLPTRCKISYNDKADGFSLPFKSNLKDFSYFATGGLLIRSYYFIHRPDRTVITELPLKRTWWGRLLGRPLPEFAGRTS